MRVIWGTVIEDGKQVRKHVILEDRICKTCGKDFSPHKTASFYCSTKCSLLASYKRRDKPIFDDKPCKICGTMFTPRKGNSRCCSKECSRLASQKQSYEIKDKKRHDSKRKELIEQNGFVCSECGGTFTSRRLAAHHKTMDNTEHDFQELRCISCHMRLHMLANPSNPKVLTKEQIENALASFDFLEDACKFLGVGRSFLYKKRKEYELPLRVGLRGRKRRIK